MATLWEQMTNTPWWRGSTEAEAAAGGDESNKGGETPTLLGAKSKSLDKVQGSMVHVQTRDALSPQGVKPVCSLPSRPSGDQDPLMEASEKLKQDSQDFEILVVASDSEVKPQDQGEGVSIEIEVMDTVFSTIPTEGVRITQESSRPATSKRDGSSSLSYPMVDESVGERPTMSPGKSSESMASNFPLPVKTCKSIKALEKLLLFEEELSEYQRQAAQDAEALRSLEEELERMKKRAEEEAENRRALEDQLEAARQKLEQEKQHQKEVSEDFKRRQAQLRQEEEEARQEEEDALAQLPEEVAKQAQEERRRQQRHLVTQVREQAQQAKQEREAKERVRAWLAAEGFRHIRARARGWAPVSTFPLHRAVQQCDAELVRLLLSHGADYRQTNCWGRTPVHLAKRLNKDGSHKEVLSVLSLVATTASFA